MVAKKEIEEIYSKSVRSGRRTYFFDVRSTRAEDYYLTITESKRDFNEDGTPSTKNIRYIFTKKILRVFKMLLLKLVNLSLKKKDPKLFPIQTTAKKPQAQKMKELILQNLVLQR